MRGMVVLLLILTDDAARPGADPIRSARSITHDRWRRGGSGRGNRRGIETASVTAPARASAVPRACAKRARRHSGYCRTVVERPVALLGPSLSTWNTEKPCSIKKVDSPL